MASTQEPEVQFAQRLASNERPIRMKALKKLRKYINVRSQKVTGGFTGDELLKLWKGLFYCLWMQDKPLLQEELSNQISTLIHSFHDITGQFLYFESFLQTFKREWNGIDRLRMDKFFQLVRFMFRQMFEMLKRKNWESSLVARFLELLTTQLLQRSSAAPSGLQFHILDLYMTELAAVGSAELTADQNLTFIEPFCKTAAKTKDRILFGAISNSIFSAIIDQAPFAIEDLMKEVKASEDSDSGQGSEDYDEDQLKEKTRKLSKKRTGKQANGIKSNEEEEEDELHLEASDTQLSCDEDIGSVLQFDYVAVADKLFQLASQTSTPSKNRQRLYKIIKVLRDLSEGIFPQDEYPEEVSTDEDDEMFGSRKRMKRGGAHVEEGEEETPAVKKRKKKVSRFNKQNKALGKDEQTSLTTNDKKKKRKKKEAGHGQSAAGVENPERSEQGQTVAQTQSLSKETKEGLKCSQVEDLEKEAQAQNFISFIKVTQRATPNGQSNILLSSDVNKLLLDKVTEDASKPKPCITDEDQCETFSVKKKRETCEPKLTETGEEQQTLPTPGLEMSSEADAPVSWKKKKSLKAELQRHGIKIQSQVRAEAEITPESSEALGEETTIPTPQADATTPAKKKQKGLKAGRKPGGSDVQSQINGLSSDVTTPHCKGSAKHVTKRGIEGKHTNAELTSEASRTAAVSLQKKTKKKVKLVHDMEETNQSPESTTLDTSSATDDSTVTPLKKKTKNKKGAKIMAEEYQAVVATDKVLFETSMTTLAKKKKTPKLLAIQANKIKAETQLHVFHRGDAELPLDESNAVSSSGKLAKKKRKIPVVFEFEADEMEEAACIDFAEKEALAKKTKLRNDAGEPATHLSTEKSQRKMITSSDFITFQSKVVVPTPLFCKASGSSSTPPVSKKRSPSTETPKSEFKKVTFGLKNNKMAEFRKTDRSLLVSPVGSSRVPFDPSQKPKFGVLKSLPTPHLTSIKKTPTTNAKTRLNTPKSTPRRRPSAADFF